MVHKDFDIDARLSLLFIRASHRNLDKKDYHCDRAAEYTAACKDIQRWLQALAALKVAIPPISSNAIGTHNAAVSLSALTQWVCFVTSQTSIRVITL